MQEQPLAVRQYRMTVAGQMFKHLGLQMYSGAVPALAELISNAYDAMAKEVKITIPIGRPLEATDEIIVTDNGHGMSYDECNASYLTVGRDRRAGGAEWTAAYNGLKPRRVQGRKGIGKLAGFGIADRIEVRSVRDGKVQHFALDFSQLTKSQKFADEGGYAPDPLADDGKPTTEKPGTRVTLSQLKITRAIPDDQFRRGIARRLLVLGPDFKVVVNGKAITRSEMPLQFRFPKKSGSWETEELPGGQSIQWWAGFSKDTIPEEEQRGFVVYVRGKLAQTPWFFDLSGGMWGQHGLQYLTGEVKADFLDETVDLIATDRGAVRWEEPAAAPLKAWGQSKIRELLDLWVERRREEKTKSPRVREYLRQAENLPEEERKIFKAVVDRIVAIPQLDKDKEGRDIAEELVEFAYNALTNRSFLNAIRRLNAATPGDIGKFTEVLTEWDIIEAVNTAHLVKGRVEIIRKFEQMINERVPEKPDMQDYLRDHPWLIDPKWTMLVHEKQLDTLLAKHFKSKSAGGSEGGKRLDYFCLGDKYQTAHVVEVKRPGIVVGRKEADQLRDYVLYLQKELQKSSTAAEYRRTTIKGLLVADKIRAGDEGHIKLNQDAGIFDHRTWQNLLHTTETLHDEFLKAVKERAPSDDPRIKGLNDLPGKKARAKKKKKKSKTKQKKSSS